MNPFGPFGNMMPYTNFHSMNLDWVIQIAKDFLDQYTNIQQIISDGEQSLQDTTDSGLEQLQEKADNLQALLDEWYNTHSDDIATELDAALADITSFANAEITRVTASIPADYSTLSTSALRFISDIGSPATYSNLLANVDIPVITGVAAEDGWTDFPGDFAAGIFINYKYYDTFAMQMFVSYVGGRMFTRVVNCSTGTILDDWHEYALNNSALMKKLEPDPADYNNLLGKINDSGFLSIGVNPAWTDMPESNFAGVVLNFIYTGTYALQLAYRYLNNKYYTYMRFVDTTSGTAFLNDWTRIDGVDSCRVENSLDPTLYDGQLLKVTKSVRCAFASATGWTDFPPNTTVGYFSNEFYGTANIQTFVSYPTMQTYKRINNFNGTTSLTPWIPFSGGQNSTVYYAIGDSITSGSYSNDQGEGVVATNAEWSYPNRIKRNYGCTVKNIAVPGAAITDFMTQANLVNTDASIVTIMGGTNDYIGSTPLGDHTSTGSSTVCGVLKSVIEAVATNAPNARIILISPFIIKTGSSSTKWSLNYAGSAGFTFAQLADAMKDIAEDYNIEFLDGTRTGPTNVLNIGDVQKDNVHPTQDFYNTIATWVGSKLF